VIDHVQLRFEFSHINRSTVQGNAQKEIVGHWL